MFSAEPEEVPLGGWSSEWLCVGGPKWWLSGALQMLLLIAHFFAHFMLNAHLPSKLDEISRSE